MTLQPKNNSTTVVFPFQKRYQAYFVQCHVSFNEKIVLEQICHSKVTRGRSKGKVLNNGIA